MNYILNIDTAVETASICIAKNGESIALRTNPYQKDHAAWLQTTIKDLMSETGLHLAQLQAVAVSAGPGSYTGLRVGMATAKGLCYALQLPLILVNTLQMMAVAALQEPTNLLCPLIDARRLEVFTAVYDKQLNEVMASKNLILNESSFIELLQKNTITFFGNGSIKLQSILQHPNAVFKNIEATAIHLGFLSFQHYQTRQFSDIAYSEPYYGKEFYSPEPKKKL